MTQYVDTVVLLTTETQSLALLSLTDADRMPASLRAARFGALVDVG